MKRICFFILKLILIATFFFPNVNLAQEYVHYNTLSQSIYPIYSVSFNPDGTILATGGEDKTIELWDVNTGILKKTLTGRTGGVHSLSFSPDGLTLVSGIGDHTIRFWNVNSGRHFHTLTGMRGVCAA